MHPAPAGMDVARKVVILARECGLRTELEAVSVQSLVPEPLRDARSAEDFLAGLPQVRPPSVNSSRLMPPIAAGLTKGPCMHFHRCMHDALLLVSTMSAICVLPYPQHDAEMEERVAHAAAAGKKLVYVGSVDMASGACSVSLEARHLMTHAVSTACTSTCMCCSECSEEWC